MKITRLLFTLSMVMLIFALLPVMDRPLKKPVPPRPDYSTLQRMIGSYLAEQPGTYGLYFIDLNSGAEFGYNAMTPFHAASTFKLPMNLYLYQESAQSGLNLGEKLALAEKHLEGGTGILKDQTPGSYYTIAQLAEYSVIQSDNVATNILLEKLGRQNVKDFMRSLGAMVVDNDANVTCPFDLALYMRETLAFARSQAPNHQLLLNDLFDSRYKDRIPGPLPRGTRIANKIGTWPPEHTYNDAAYVVHPERPYILVITSKNTPGYGETLPVIHHLSELVYNYQTDLKDREENPLD